MKETNNKKTKKENEMKNNEIRATWLEDGKELDINQINTNNNIPSFTEEEYENEKVIKSDFHICLDGTIINYSITDLDLKRKEFSLTSLPRKEMQIELQKILDKEYGVFRHTN
jgi:hypothetical protein